MLGLMRGANIRLGINFLTSLNIRQRYKVYIVKANFISENINTKYNNSIKLQSLRVDMRKKLL